MPSKRDYGTHSVTKRRTSWRCTIRLPKDELTGKRPKKVFVGKTKQEAIAKAEEFKRLMNAGVDIEQGSTLLKDFLPRWVDGYCISQQLKKSSRAAYVTMTKNVVRVLGDHPIKNIKPFHLDELVASGGDTITTSTVRAYRLLKLSLADAETNGIIERSPFIRHRPPKPPASGEARFFTQDEVFKVLEASKGTRLHRPIQFLLATGLRSSELFALRKSDLHLDEEFPYITVAHNVRTSEGTPEWGDAKTKNGLRSIDLSPATVELLRSHMGTLLLEQVKAHYWEDDSLLFPSSVGSVWNYRNFLKMWKRVITKAGIPDASPHACRHSVTLHLPFKLVSKPSCFQGAWVTEAWRSHWTSMGIFFLVVRRFHRRLWTAS